MKVNTEKDTNNDGQKIDPTHTERDATNLVKHRNKKGRQWTEYVSSFFSIIQQLN